MGTGGVSEGMMISCDYWEREGVGVSVGTGRAVGKAGGENG